MFESFFGFKKTPFSDSPDGKQVFASEMRFKILRQGWRQVKTRLEFLTQHPGAGLLTGEVGAGKSTAARVFSAALNPNLHKTLYVHFTNGSALDLLRQIALTLDLEPAHFRGDNALSSSCAIGAADLRGHRALEPEQEATSDSHLRRSASVAASGARTTSAVVELQ